MRSRAGVTLLELLVVLVLLGLAAGLAAPVLRPRATAADDPTARTIAAARALALRRAESLRLDVGADGRWAIVARGDSVLQRGALPPTGAALRLGISPLGVCVPEAGDDGTSATAWDAASCTPLQAGAGGARGG